MVNQEKSLLMAFWQTQTRPRILKSFFFVFSIFIHLNHSEAHSWNLEEIRSALMKVTREAHGLGQSLVEARKAAEALELYSGPSDPLPVIRIGLASFDQLVRQSCVKALDPKLGPGAFTLSVEILKGTSEAGSDFETLEMAARFLWRFVRDPNFPDQIDSILRTTPMHRRELVAETLVACGPNCRSAILTALRDKNPLVRAYGFKALRYLDNETALPLIKRGLNSLEFLETEGAAVALQGRRHPEVLKLIETAIRLPYFKARIQGYLALSNQALTPRVAELYIFGLREALRTDRVSVLLSLMVRDDFASLQVQQLLELAANEEIIPRSEKEQRKIIRWRWRDTLAELKRPLRSNGPSFRLSALETFDLQNFIFHQTLRGSDIEDLAEYFLEFLSQQATNGNPVCNGNLKILVSDPAF